MTEIIVNGTQDKKVVTILIVSLEPLTEVTLTQAVQKWLNTLGVVDAQNDYEKSVPNLEEDNAGPDSGIQCERTNPDTESDNYCGAV